MQKIWRPRAVLPESNLNILSHLLRQLLTQRGLTDQTAVENFLAPDYERDLHDPFLMLDMEKAAQKIIETIKRKDRIAVFADYDADGVPGAVVLADFFRRVGFTNFTVYIPDRHDESYGLNEPALAALAQGGAKLVITVDCGITDVAPVAEANRLGLQVIITDHHLVPEIMPNAYAIVNPKRPDDPYPYKMLAGAGVAFKLVQALSRVVLEASPRTTLGIGWEKWLLDLVAIATVADMVPLTGENRALVYFGLKVLRRTPRLGLRQLFRILNLRSEFITEDDVSFLIGPRLNSASRMSHGDEAYNLLISENKLEAERLARHLENKNRERRALVTSILDTAQNGGTTNENVLIIGDPSWSLGVLGLAAGRLVENLGRPVFVWSRNGRGEIKGSCRSDGTVNMVELMKVADETARGGNLFLNYGGHAGAGGFSLSPERLPELAARVNRSYDSLGGKASKLSDDLFYDWELTLATANFETYALLECLAPFGLENHKPVFLLSDLPLVSTRTFGQDMNHLELNLGSIKAVQFFVPPPAVSSPSVGARLDLLASLEKSYWRGAPELRLRLVDWRAAV